MRAKEKAERLAAAECSNWYSGACRGTDTLTVFTVPLARCLIRFGLPCRYFERCVLPLAMRRPEYAPAGNDYYRRTRGSIAVRIKCIEDEDLRMAVQDHPFMGRLPREGNGAVRRCECGAPLARRKRLCADCRAKRRRESYRRANRERNGNGASGVQQLSESRTLLGKDL